MTFLELHQFIKQDLLIYSWILNNFCLTQHKLEVGTELVMNNEQVIIMEKGLLAQESIESKTIIHRIFEDQRIIFNTEVNLSLTALEDTTYRIVDKKDLLDELDSQKLLPHFLLQIAEDFEQDLEQERKLMSANSEERIELILTKIIDRHQLDSVTNPTFPKWLKIYVLARLAKCSVSTTSIVVNELAQKGVINVKTTPWQLVENSQISCA